MLFHGIFGSVNVFVLFLNFLEQNDANTALYAPTKRIHRESHPFCSAFQGVASKLDSL